MGQFYKLQLNCGPSEDVGGYGFHAEAMVHFGNWCLRGDKLNFHI